MSRTSVETPEQVLAVLAEVKDETKEIQIIRCQHCRHRWLPRWTRMPKWCPRCHRNLDVEWNDQMREKKQRIDLLEVERYTPAAMKGLCQAQLYKYKGMPDGLPKMTAGRDKQRKANLRLTDRYFRGPLTISQLATALRISREGVHIRVSKGFKIMLERACFVLTDKGRENIAQSRAKREIARLEREEAQA